MISIILLLIKYEQLLKWITRYVKQVKNHTPQYTVIRYLNLSNEFSNSHNEFKCDYVNYLKDEVK